MAHQSNGMAFTPIKGAELEDFLEDSNITTSRAPGTCIGHYFQLSYIERHDLRDLFFAWLEVSHDTTDVLSLCPITRSQRESFFSSIFSDWDSSKPTWSPQYIHCVETEGKIEIGVLSKNLPVSLEEVQRALQNGEQEPRRQHNTARQAGQKAFMIPAIVKKGHKPVITFVCVDADGEFNLFPEYVTFKPGGLPREDYMRALREYDERKASWAYQYNIEAIIDTARKRIVRYSNDGVIPGRLPVTSHRVPIRVTLDPILPQIESGDAHLETC